MSEASPEMQKYFDTIEEQIDEAYVLADKAKSKGYDPDEKVTIVRAKNMAERVIALISVVAPQIKDSGAVERILELEKQYGKSDWRIAFKIAEEVSFEKFCKFKDKREAMEVGMRVGLAYITNGVVASPLEGFVKLELKKRRDGKDYFALFFSGPIRSAGTTATCVFVALADYVRRKHHFEIYDPDEKEIKRMSRELHDFHERITNLQYLPSEEEIEFMVSHLPLQIDGDPSEKLEVSNYKDLDRIATNNLRNGVCLTVGEGLTQKGKKFWAKFSQWNKDFEMEEWSWMGDFVNLQKIIRAKKEAKTENKKEEKTSKIAPDYNYIKDLVAGRPVLTYPLTQGGFRLRYGRSRTSGYSADSLHPATMAVLDDFIAIGTQFKVERPGKGCTVTSCDSIEGPTVKLEDGSVVRINSRKQLKSLKKKVIEILYLGDILINYGDFLDRGHVLVPPGYCEEWWILEVEKATVDMFGSLDIEKLSNHLNLPLSLLENLFNTPLKSRPNIKEAIKMSKGLNIPLHPHYIPHWKAISVRDLGFLIDWLDRSKIEKSGKDIKKIIFNYDKKGKEILEAIGVPHSIVLNEYVVIEKEDAESLITCLGFDKEESLSDKKSKASGSTETVEAINKISGVKIRDKSGLFIGARMGRPEKGKMRKLTGSPHTLFPVGEEGGRLRSFQECMMHGKVESDFPVFLCEKCNISTIFSACHKCHEKTVKKYECGTCGTIDTPECPKHGKTRSYKLQKIPIREIFEATLNKLKMPHYPDLIKGVRGTSNEDHMPEHISKGILRAKHSVCVNKDGTTRFDMTQMPLTHFKPKEIGTPFERLKELGYLRDVYGKDLVSDEQILEIKPQDIVLPAAEESPDDGADKILFNVANFCDEMLVKLYGLEPYYNLKSPSDIVGGLCLALAPHTSAAIITRIIGFSNTQVFFAHPLTHAATRRDCDGDEASVVLLMDALLNFSSSYLPSHRGSKQDAPLVLTSLLIPSEVDDMIFNVDTVSRYPLEFYEACLQYKNPWEIKIDTFGKFLNTPRQYEGSMFTHDTEDINKGTRCSAYKTLPTMEDKLKGQMGLAEKIKAVDKSDVAALVIDKHFLKDIKGNLRKFSQQQFRCVKCNEKYRRPPLIGKCYSCGGKIIFTISEGSIIKYLEPALSLAEKYGVPPYMKQTLDLTKRRIEGVFGKEKEKQEGLGKWFG